MSLGAIEFFVWIFIFQRHAYGKDLCFSETSELSGSISLNEQVDSTCIYKISPKEDSLVKITLHEVSVDDDCFDASKIYISSSDGISGPYCHRDLPRYRRDLSEAVTTVEPDMTTTTAGQTTTTRDFSYVEREGNPQDGDLDRKKTSIVEGMFRNPNVIYVKMPTGKTVKFGFNFDWEVVYRPSYKDSYDRAEMQADGCFLNDLTDPILEVAHETYETSDDPQKALFYIYQFTEAFKHFQDVFDDQHYEYCEPLSIMIPCNFIAFAPRTTIQEVAGVLGAIVRGLVGQCADGFGYRWQEQIKILNQAVGGTIPRVVASSDSFDPNNPVDIQDVFLNVPFKLPLEAVLGDLTKFTGQSTVEEDSQRFVEVATVQTSTEVETTTRQVTTTRRTTSTTSTTISTTTTTTTTTATTTSTTTTTTTTTSTTTTTEETTTTELTTTTYTTTTDSPTTTTATTYVSTTQVVTIVSVTTTAIPTTTTPTTTTTTMPPLTQVMCEVENKKYCVNWKTDNILLKKYEDESTVQECHDRCKAFPGCVSFHLNSISNRCILNRAGCRMKAHRTFDFYDMRKCGTGPSGISRTVVNDEPEGSGGGLFPGLDTSLFDNFFSEELGVDTEELDLEASGDDDAEENDQKRGLKRVEKIVLKGANRDHQQNRLNYQPSNGPQCGLSRSSIGAKSHAMASFHKIADDRPSRWGQALLSKFESYINYIFKANNECDYVFVDCDVHSSLLGRNSAATVMDLLTSASNFAIQIEYFCNT